MADKPVWIVPDDAALVRCAAEDLVRLADHPDSDVRRRAIDELGRRGAIAELATLLGHPGDDVRQHVPHALLACGVAAHDQIPLLAQGLNSPDESTREATVQALLLLSREHGPYRGDRPPHLR